MSDEELTKIAESGDDLTVPAQDALLGEASKRGIELIISAPPQEDTAEPTNLVTLRQFRDLPEALLAKGSLDSVGIETCLADDNMIRGHPSTGVYKLTERIVELGKENFLQQARS
jgi:hypothetical protein